MERQSSRRRSLMILFGAVVCRDHLCEWRLRLGVSDTPYVVVYLHPIRPDTKETIEERKGQELEDETNKAHLGN
jgi:hypothetical protein